VGRGRSAGSRSRARGLGRGFFTTPPSTRRADAPLWIHLPQLSTPGSTWCGRGMTAHTSSVENHPCVKALNCVANACSHCRGERGAYAVLQSTTHASDWALSLTAAGAAHRRCARHDRGLVTRPFAFRDRYAAGVPVFAILDFPIPERYAPGLRGGPWLKPSLDYCGYGVREGQKSCIRRSPGSKTRCFSYKDPTCIIDTQGTLMPDDWANELHAYPNGFKHCALVREALRASSPTNLSGSRLLQFAVHHRLHHRSQGSRRVPYCRSPRVDNRFADRHSHLSGALLVTTASVVRFFLNSSIGDIE